MLVIAIVRLLQLIVIIQVLRNMYLHRILRIIARSINPSIILTSIPIHGTLGKSLLPQILELLTASLGEGG
jgi:hypothetical protein